MLSTAEKHERRAAVEDVIGTHRVEGIRVDATVEKLMRQFADGDITLDQFSAAVDEYANSLLTKEQSLAGAA